MPAAHLLPRNLAGLLDRHWRLAVVLAWLAACAMLWSAKQGAIEAFFLSDTDDNMRLLQVRDWLAGQGWFDLRQHRMDPALGGADIHWSRLVDLPIAALMLALRPLLGLVEGDRWAVALAPLLPLGVMLAGLALTCRRLLGGASYGLAFLALLSASSLTGMYNPMRIDHHGWQLALLAVAMAGAVDPRPARGGVTLGVATALSLAIGLEALIWLALLAAALVLGWVASGAREAARLRGYGAALVAALIPLFGLFVSEANRAARCDALSPVWLADALLGAGLLWALVAAGHRGGARWPMRLALAAGAGVIVGAFHALAFPHCLQRLEGVSPEATELWLANVREARPITRHGWRVSSLIAALPVAGVIGYAVLLWMRGRRRAVAGPDDGLRAAVTLALPALAAFALLFWQTRAGPAAQLLAIPGAIALIVMLLPRVWGARLAVVQVGGALALCLVGFGALPGLVAKWLPNRAQAASGNGTAQARARAKVAPMVSRANRRCFDAANLRLLDRVPAGVVLTHVDLGPRLVAMTHHSAIAGPYHRNGAAIVDIMRAFRGTPQRALETVQRHRAAYLLICPMMSESTVYAAKAPDGFYRQLIHGKVPAWLDPVALPKDAPFRLWRIVR